MANTPEKKVKTKKKKPNKGWAKLKKVLRNKVIEHHISYEYSGTTHKQEEIVVPVYYMEHHLLTQLQRRGKFVSKGFLRTLEHFIWKHKESATDLSLEVSDTIGEVDERKKSKGIKEEDIR